MFCRQTGQSPWSVLRVFAQVMQTHKWWHGTSRLSLAPSIQTTHSVGGAASALLAPTSWDAGCCSEVCSCWACKEYKPPCPASRFGSCETGTWPSCNSVLSLCLWTLLRSSTCAWLKTRGVFPERKKRVLPIPSRNCRTFWMESWLVCLARVISTSAIQYTGYRNLMPKQRLKKMRECQQQSDKHCTLYR